MTTQTEKSIMQAPASQTTPSISHGALKGLAIVGFITLIVVGVLLAIYAARFVPTAIKGLNYAAVSLSQIFTPSKPSTLSVVPTPVTNIATSTKSISGIATTTITVPKAVHSTTTKRNRSSRIIPKAGKRTTNTYLIGTHSKLPRLHGLPDLTVRIDAVGYLTSTSTSSFVATTTAPANSHVAVKFTITNIGTNVAGSWKFSASLPTQVNYLFNSVTQQPLNPEDHIDYILSFDQANTGTNQTISVTVNPKHTIIESNFKNNSAAKSMTVLGN